MPRMRTIVLAITFGASSAGCASVVVSRDANLVVLGHVHDDPSQAVRVTVDSENRLPPLSGTPVAGCEVTLTSRAVTGPGAAAFAAIDRSDAEGQFSVFGGREPGPYDVVLTVECPSYAPVEYVFEHREPRRYRAAVFVARTR